MIHVRLTFVFIMDRIFLVRIIRTVVNEVIDLIKMFNNVYVRTFVCFLSIYISCEFLVQPACNSTICGANGVCQNSELKVNGYLCQCSNYTVFNGITCVRKC